MNATLRVRSPCGQTKLSAAGRVVFGSKFSPKIRPESGRADGLIFAQKDAVFNR
jgi:hypothetical protein